MFERWPYWSRGFLQQHRHRGWQGLLLDLLFPSRCQGCGRYGSWLCDACREALPQIPKPVCRHCGRPSGVQTCPACWRSPLHIDGIRAKYYFGDTLRRMIHRFKYRRAEHLADPLAELLMACLGESDIAATVIVPVPLSPKRLQERGYNQAALLTACLGEHAALPIVDDCLSRLKDTSPQMSLPASQRWGNVRGAFQCLDRRLSNQDVLLVDDVCTTGATLDACAIALKRGGAKSVWGLVVARAK